MGSKALFAKDSKAPQALCTTFMHQAAARGLAAVFSHIIFFAELHFLCAIPRTGDGTLYSCLQLQFAAVDHVNLFAKMLYNAPCMFWRCFQISPTSACEYSSKSSSGYFWARRSAPRHLWISSSTFRIVEIQDTSGSAFSVDCRMTRRSRGAAAAAVCNFSQTPGALSVFQLRRTCP